ncbi:MAG TPA: Wzz/FepE/Etk N-terminal domain-containing protein [Candidatus Baltobacteraceae bacterium]|jgi:capsular polysaccharide biosynthesis protein
MGLLHDLYKILDVLQRRRILVYVSLAVGLVVMVLALRVIPKSYESSSRVLIVADNNGRDPSVTSIDLPAVATSTAVLSRVMEDLKLPVSLSSLKHSVKARVSPRSSIMEITYRDTQPDRAVAVPNAIADELSLYYETISTSRADSTIAKLDAAIAASLQRIELLSRRIAVQSAHDPLVQSDHAFTALTARLDDLTSQRQFARVALEADMAARNALSGSPALSKIARHEELQNDSTYGELAAGTAKDAAALAFTKAAYTGRYPGLPGLKTKVEAERQATESRERATIASPNAYSPSLAANELEQRKAEGVIIGDRAKVAAIDTLVAQTKAQLRDLPSATATEEQLRLKQDAAKADYLALTGQRTAAVASRAEALSLGSVVVVDRAVRADAAVVGLSGIRLAAMVFLLVLSFALASAYVAEMLDPHLRRPSQIEDMYGAHLIATLSMDQ